MRVTKTLHLGYWTRKVSPSVFRDVAAPNVILVNLQSLEQEKVITEIRVRDEELNEKFKVLELVE